MKTATQTDLAVAAALELALEVAGQRPDDPYELGRDDRRTLAVIATAWELQGYNLAFVADAYTGHRHEMQERIYQALRHRPRRELRVEARGMIRGMRLLADGGLYTGTTASEARRQIWLATQERRIA